MKYEQDAFDNNNSGTKMGNELDYIVDIRDEGTENQKHRITRQT